MPAKSPPLFPATLFLALGAHNPIATALEWLLAEIWPQITARLPSASLHVIGEWSAADQTAFARPGVVFLGFVKELSAALRGGIMLVPLRVGSGLRVKNPRGTDTRGPRGDDHHRRRRLAGRSRNRNARRECRERICAGRRETGCGTGALVGHGPGGARSGQKKLLARHRTRAAQPDLPGADVEKVRRQKCW